MNDLKFNDTTSWLDTVWSALHGFRDQCIPEGQLVHDAQWSDICTAMSWIAGELGLEDYPFDEDL